MKKSLFAPAAMFSILAVAAAGCAHQPPPEVAGELNVMQAASQMGYNTPRVVDGKTYYCQTQELIGSMVPKETCISSDQVLARARAQGDLLKYMAQPPNGVQRPGGGGA
jgi:hypothetical protein